VEILEIAIVTDLNEHACHLTTYANIVPLDICIYITIDVNVRFIKTMYEQKTKAHPNLELQLL
jgi:hypothetical protein